MKQFEVITKDIDALVNFLAQEYKGANNGCAGCDRYNECSGSETCRKAWEDFLNSEIQSPHLNYSN